MDFIDTHCHLDFPDFDSDRPQVIAKAKNNGLVAVINIGTSLNNSQKSIQLAKEFDCVFASVGIHPHEADKVRQDDWTLLESLLVEPKVVAIGETGLDYYRNLSKPSKQKEVFERFILLAKNHNLPLVIHCRQAQEDVLSILKDHRPVAGVVMHCFSGDENFLKQCLEQGFLISFTCNITYKKARELRDLIPLVPLERILLETDAPFLAPEGLRGKRNEPLNAREVAREVSTIKKLSIEEICRLTTDNAKRFFKLP